MLVEAPAIPWWGWVFIGLFLILMILFLLRLGYTVYSEITGFGLHVVKETETSEYEGEVAKNPDAEESQAQKRLITTERQTPRTIWDWMTVLTISAVIGVAALIFTWSQAEQQRYVQDQQAKDAVLQEYLDKMTQMMLDDDDPLLKAEAGSPERAAARARTRRAAGGFTTTAGAHATTQGRTGTAATRNICGQSRSRNRYGGSYADCCGTPNG